MDKKPLIVGQAPSRDTDGGPPFSGRSGKRLAALLGVPHERLGDAFDLDNLVDRWPGKAGKGDRFPTEEARRKAARMDLSGRPFVLLVGKNVARAFSFDREYFAWEDLGGSPAAVVPHPSGVNRWWNDPENRARADRFFTLSPPRTRA